MEDAAAPSNSGGLILAQVALPKAVSSAGEHVPWHALKMPHNNAKRLLMNRTFRRAHCRGRGYRI